MRIKHLRNGKKKISICNICKYESVSHWNLKLHILSQHSTLDERKAHKYYCECCDLVFFCETYMNKHLNGKVHKNRELCEKYQNELNIKQQNSQLIILKNLNNLYINYLIYYLCVFILRL
jgi:hypothetical protein